MEKISIFNYEAYYLDLLEGNLSEEDTALLLDFLEQHPHLKLDHEFMPELDWAMGYPYALVLMTASALVPMWYFRRRGWLK